VLTADDLDAAVAFYSGALGVPQWASLEDPEGRVVILDAGHATLEITDLPHARYVDRVEGVPDVERPDDPRPEASPTAATARPDADAHGHTGFLLRGRRFAWLLVDHHGDGRLALWVKAPPGEQAGLVAQDPARESATSDSKKTRNVRALTSYRTSTLGRYGSVGGGYLPWLATAAIAAAAASASR
jgi:catechol 2,3-dioxygenase-like lactoylglutathione lyase family enzyme